MSHDREKDKWITEAYPIVFRRVFNALRRKGFGSDLAAELASDGAQQAVVTFLQQESQIWPAPSFQQFVAWLTTVATRYGTADRRRRRILFTDTALLEQYEDDEAIDRALIQAVRDAFAQDLSAEDRTVLEMKYEQKLSDTVIAQELLPPDGRTSGARAQALRLKRLEAETRLARSLAARGYQEFSLDGAANEDYSNGTKSPSD